MIILSIITFIIVFGILVFVHELGHFFAAKKAGVTVEEFGFGFPPRIFGIKKKETTYSINLIPLGGFVKMLGQDDFDVDSASKDEKNKGNFNNKPAYKRALIMIAGVVMNFVLAFILVTIGFSIGMPVLSDGIDRFEGAEIESNVLVLSVSDNTPGSQAGLQPGDAIARIDDKAIENKLDLQDYIGSHKGREIVLDVKRDDENHDLVSLTPREEYPENEGAIGIGIEESQIVKYPWYKAIFIGARETVYITGLIAVALFEFFKDIFVSLHVSDEAAGPVGIAKMSGHVAQLGFVYLLQFVALLSINLAIINILPFPGLDGGRLLFLGIEKIIGKPINPKVENIIHLAGFGLLIVLIIVVTYKDVLRFF